MAKSIDVIIERQLGPQLRPMSDALSAFAVMREAFFGDGGSDGLSPVKDDIGDSGTEV
jgi:hypothetical protein